MSKFKQSHVGILKGRSILYQSAYMDMTSSLWNEENKHTEPVNKGHRIQD